ncbi:MAG: nitroreductase family protein [Pirellulales bacterium]|nr:nitroreductase family protein [Pirellulales bacterium]
MLSTQFTSHLAAAIRSRRSIRSYSAEPIAKSDVLDVLALTGRAPSAWNLQPWRFIAVVDSEIKTALQRVAYGQSQVGGAPVVIVLYSDMVDALARVDEALPPDASPAARDKLRANISGYFEKLTPEQREAWGRAQTGIALGYLLLILESRGYGSSPMLGFDATGVKRLFSLADHVEVAALVAFGKPADAGRHSVRHKLDSIARVV